MLAVAAVLALAVPALGAATPIVAPPATEQLVEGHTVFTVIEIFNNTTTVKAEFAAAVAVLVREYDAAQRNVRFPGVLWFNDQYLTNPTDGTDDYQDFRYPCGGSVMAVNAGHEDPRVILANTQSPDETRDTVFGVDYGDNGGYYPGAPGPDGTPENDADDADAAWVNATGPGTADSDVTVTSLAPDADRILPSRVGFVNRPDLLPDVFDYQESYLITDPNDHVWIIDKYQMYQKVGTSTLLSQTGPTHVLRTTPVWVVNILGSPVFIPDDGFMSCGPYADLVSSVYNSQYYPGELRDGTIANGAQTADDAIRPGYNGAVGSRLPYRDEPVMGYREPTEEYCYNGNPTPCTADVPTQPQRLYNALLYFKLADLTVEGTPRDHTPGAIVPPDTNGCQVGTEWICPDGDDNREGNSHEFHPTPGTGDRSLLRPNPVHTDEGACPAYFQDPAAPEPTNHGGSTNPYAPYCDHLHATRNVDIYFSPTARPFAPLYRFWAVQDVQGSSAPFHSDGNHHDGEHDQTPV